MANVLVLSTGDTSRDKFCRLDYDIIVDALRSDRFGVHLCVNDPVAADIVLFIGSTYHDHRDIRRHLYARDFPEKVFVFDSSDEVIPFFPGIYATISKLWHSGRTVTGFFPKVLTNSRISTSPLQENADYLYSFVGSSRSHPVRERLMRLQDRRAFVEDSSAAVPACERNRPLFMVTYCNEDREHYADVMRRSKFVLAPRGYCCSGYRIFEAMKAGRIPVIISDGWVPPPGPRWEEFSVRVRQREVEHIPALLRRYEPQASRMACLATRAWDEWYAADVCFHRIVEWCLELKRSRRPGLLQSTVPYLQYFRPFFLRQVVLPELGRALHVHGRPSRTSPDGR